MESQTIDHQGTNLPRSIQSSMDNSCWTWPFLSCICKLSSSEQKLNHIRLQSYSTHHQLWIYSLMDQEAIKPPSRNGGDRLVTPDASSRYTPGRTHTTRSSKRQPVDNELKPENPVLVAGGFSFPPFSHFPVMRLMVYERKRKG